VGVQVQRTRRLAYVLAAAGFGAIGAMLIISGLYIDPASVFNINYSADMLFMVVIGGLGTIEGPLIGALILFAAQQVFAQYGAWYLVGLGGLAIAVVLLAPAGLWGIVSGRRGWSLLPVGYRVRSPGGPHDRLP
jgi:branched-chain amino acid transport system permease protein